MYFWLVVPEICFNQSEVLPRSGWCMSPVFLMAKGEISRACTPLGTLRTTSTSMKTSPKNIDSASFQTISRLSQVAQLLKRREFMLKLKRGSPHPCLDRDGRIYCLAVPSSKKLKFWSFHVVVVQGQQRNVQKNVMHAQSCCFGYLTHSCFTLPSPSRSRFRKVPIAALCNNLFHFSWHLQFFDNRVHIWPRLRLSLYSSPRKVLMVTVHLSLTIPWDWLFSDAHFTEEDTKTIHINLIIKKIEN